MDNYLIAKATNVGQVRQVNEDYMTVFDSPNGQVMAVCDGMGGQAAGDVASQLTVEIIENILTDNTFDTPEEAIRRSVIAANQGVLNRTAQNPELDGMGSTCVMLIIKNGQVHCGWVGDSRIYYIANHTIRQLSHDQSYVQEMVDRGEITPEEAINHPQKNEITNAIGLQGMIAPSTLAVPITPEPGSIFLLCSDGLSSMVDDARIERTVSSPNMTLQQKADRLVEMANEAGGLDNITVELVQFSGDEADSNSKNSISGGFTQKKTDKKRLFFMIAVAIVFIAAIAVGSYFIFGGQENPDKPVVAQPEVKPIHKPTPSEKGPSTQSSGSEKQQNNEVKTEESKQTSEKKQNPSPKKPAPSPKKKIENAVKTVPKQDPIVPEPDPDPEMKKAIEDKFK